MFKSSGSQVKQRFAWEPVFGLLLVVDVGRPASVDGVADGGVLGQLILQVHDRLGASDEEDGVAVVQHPHFIWGQKLTATLLKICGIGAGFSLGLAVSPSVNRGFAEGLGNVLVGAGFVASKVQYGV